VGKEVDVNGKEGGNGGRWTLTVIMGGKKGRWTLTVIGFVFVNTLINNNIFKIEF
jgi:hypothetical protein